MEKRIFNTEEVVTEPIKPKREFITAEVREDKDNPPDAELMIAVVKPTKWYSKVFITCIGLFIIAVFAQSIQLIIDTYQQHQWIYLSFSLVFFGICLAGIGALISEWRKLVRLRKHQQYQSHSQQLLNEVLPSDSGQRAVLLCKSMLKEMNKTPAIQQLSEKWQQQLDEAYNAKEVLYLFSQTVLAPIDDQVKKQISQSASENALLVAVSPLAIVDVLFVAWRNIALINKITRAYGIELGYWSRLRLFRLVLVNMAFAGATELVSEMGLEFLSQSVTAKLSMRAAQGIGVGLLTARLGIKAMEFCRPVVFQEQEKPKLSTIRQELFSTIKSTLFSNQNAKATQDNMKQE